MTSDERTISPRRRCRLSKRWFPLATVATSVVAMLFALPTGAVAASEKRPGPVGPEIAVTAADLRTSKAQNSPMLAADPTDPRFMVAASRIDAEDYSCALEVSGNGGRGWVPAHPLRRLPPGAEKCYAPEVAFDAKGRLYYLFVGLAGNGNRPMGVYLTHSDDRARHFSTPHKILGAENFMVRMAIDTAQGRAGRIHVVWLAANAAPPLGGLPPGDNPILAMHSDDRGRTFTTPTRVSDASRPRAVAPALALGPDHTVHVGYYDLVNDARDYLGLEGPVWDGMWSLVVARSTDGGSHFDPGVVVDDGIVPAERVMLIFTMPAAALVADEQGRVFAAWPDARTGDTDVLLRRSLDGGRSWQAAQRLNDDPPGDARSQYLPRLATTPGRLDAVFYDRRDDPKNLLAGVSYTTSSDGGATFAPNVPLATVASDTRYGPRYGVVSALGLVERGSRLGLYSGPNETLAAWTDTRNDSGGADATGGPAEQDIVARRIEVPGARPATTTAPAGGGGGRSPILAIGMAVAAVAGLGVARRRRRRPARIGDERT